MEIQVKINKQTGEIKIEGFGYTNSSCVWDIEELQKILKLATLSEEVKPESVYTTEVVRAKL